MEIANPWSYVFSVGHSELDAFGILQISHSVPEIWHPVYFGDLDPVGQNLGGLPKIGGMPDANWDISMRI